MPEILSSKDVAKERLKLVLMHDRANITPQFFEMIKCDIIKAVSNYIEIEDASFDIQLSRNRNGESVRAAPSLIANIAIKSIRNPGK